MSFLNDIYHELETEFEGSSRVDHLSAFYTLLNYIELVATGSGLTEQDLQERFYQRAEYSHIVQKLIKHSVLERTSDGKYVLNNDAKSIISPMFEDLMSMVYKPEKKIKTKDPTLKLLYNCRSQIFSS